MGRMPRPVAPRAWPERLLASFLLLAVGLLAAVRRWGEPASSRVVVAEDPLTHIVFTKEHLSRGYFADSFHLGTHIYPPGLHAWAGALQSLAGIDLYALAIWSPLILGVLAVATTFLFGWRTAGLAAAAVAAFLVAIFPEIVFRSELFSPTVLDLALLPLLFLALSEAMDGRPAVLVPALVVGAALAMAHPWIVSIAVAAGLAVLVLHHQFEPRSVLPAAPRARTLTALALTGLAGLAWVVERTQDADKGIAGANLLLVAGGLALAGIFAFAERMGPGWRMSRLVRNPFVALAFGVLLAIAAWLAFAVLTSGTLPVNVDYSLMLGPAAAVAAIAGIAAWPLARSNLAHWGLVLTVLLFPFTAADLLGVWYIPHRTVAFLGLAIAFLGGAAAQTIVETIRDSVAKRNAIRRPSAARWAALVATVILVAVAAPVAAASTPEEPYRWYRLYTDDSFRALEWAADETHGGGAVRVMTHSWQSNAFLKALGVPERVVYDQGFYRGESRSLWESRSTPGYLFAVVDEHVKAEAGDPFAGSGYEVAHQSGTVTVYRWVG